MKKQPINTSKVMLKNRELKDKVRPSWDVYFLNIADQVAKRSHDPDTQVGAVIVDENNRILATGYNGFPPGCDDDNLPTTRPEKYAYMVHAEVNAIASSRQDLRGSSLYLTISPCKECAKVIITAGVKKVFFRDFYLIKDWDFIRNLFENAGIQWKNVQRF